MEFEGHSFRTLRGCFARTGMAAVVGKRHKAKENGVDWTAQKISPFPSTGAAVFIKPVEDCGRTV